MNQAVRSLCIRGVVASTMLAACASSDSDSTAWTPAFDTARSGWLLNAWGSAANDLYAVGGTPEAGVVEHYDGERWAALELGVAVPLRTWAFGFSRDDVTIVGFDGVIIHYDGATWRAQPSPTTQNLWGVWGAAPDDLWAVGGNALKASDATLLHYDGTAWTAIATPPLMRANVYAWFKVWGTAADDVYVVGQRGAAMHYDGVAWTEIFPGAPEDLISVWGTARDNIVAVGGRSQAVMTRWDGATWTPHVYPTVAGFNGVWLDSPTQAHAVGVGGAIATIELATGELRAEPVATDQELHGVFGIDATLLAVGGNLLTVQAPYLGVAFTRPLEKDRTP